MNELISFGLLLVTMFGGVGASIDARSDDAPALSLIAPIQTGAGDDALLSLRRVDNATRTSDGNIAALPASEHLRRANLYLSNRSFDEAREHFRALLSRYPNDTNIPGALLGLGRSYFLAAQYLEAAPVFQRLAREFPELREGRDGLSFHAAALLRAGKAADAVNRYIEYTQRYPNGERFESSYLNIIDGLREAGQIDEAIKWIETTQQKFKGGPTEANAMFARLRLDVSAGEWEHAVQTADEIRRIRSWKDVNTSSDEVLYLKAYSLEQAGRTQEAITAFLSIPDTSRSYYGMLATRQLQRIGGDGYQTAIGLRLSGVRNQIRASSAQYPAPYRSSILRAASRKRVDPRFVLSIMRQESSFRPGTKSPAAARGLLQLTFDTALKYKSAAGLASLVESDLYRPEISISLGAETLGDLEQKFSETPEAVAAAYNGGDDNVLRWIKRAKHMDPGVFAAEVGFNETKDYVFKVLMNYRAYRELYTADLNPR
jgi:soluble lytic murein transglycosylase